MVIHFTHFEKVTVSSTSARPKVRSEENIETVKRQMEDEPQLSLRQLSQQTELSVLICQRIVRKDLEDSVTALSPFTETTFLMCSQSTPTGSRVFSIRRGYSTRTFRYLWQFFAPMLLDEEESSNVHRS
jgi:hypothetical protein